MVKRLHQTWLRSTNCLPGLRFNRSRVGSGRDPSSLIHELNQTWAPTSVGETPAFFRLPLITCSLNGASRDSRHRHPSQNCHRGPRFNHSRAGSGRCPSSLRSLQHQTWTPASAGETHAFFRLPLMKCSRSGASRDSRHRHPPKNCRTGAGRCPSSLSSPQHQTRAPTSVGETPAFFRLPLMKCSRSGASRDSWHRHPSQNCHPGEGRDPSSLSSPQHQTRAPTGACPRMLESGVGETPAFFRLPLMKCSRSGASRDSRHRHPPKSCRTGAGRCPSSLRSLQHQTWTPTGACPRMLESGAGETPVFCRLPLEAWIPGCARMTACNLWMSL